MKSYAELIEQANIKFPVAAQKTTVYSVLGKTAEDGIDWVATTNTTVHKLAYGLEERDEARSKLIALALNNHEELVSLVAELSGVLARSMRNVDSFTSRLTSHSGRLTPC